MKKIVLGVSLTTTLLAAMPTALALSQYADSRPLATRDYTCWYIADIGEHRYVQRSINTEATGPKHAISLCTETYRQEIARSNVAVHRT